LSNHLLTVLILLRTTITCLSTWRMLQITVLQ
jgi:hypothetical protein